MTPPTEAATSRSSKPPPSTQNDIRRVLFWMAGALLSFSALALSIRGLSDRLNVFEILSLRSFGGIAILLAMTLWRPELRHSLYPRRMRLHATRNLVHFTGQLSWAQGIILLPLATAFALEFTAPIWVALLAVFVLRERLTRARLGSVVLGFIGVLAILRPGLEGFQPAALLMLFTALSFAITSIATKKLTVTEPTFAILFWMNVMQLPLNLLGSHPLFFMRLEAAHLLPVIGLMGAGLAAHFCLTNAFRWGDALVVVPLDFLRIPLVAILGWALYGEVFDPVVFLGAGLIVAGILWNLVAEARHRPALCA